MATKTLVVFASFVMLGGAGCITGCSRQQPKSKPAASTGAEAEPSAPAATPAAALTQPQRRAALEGLARRWEDPAMGAGTARQAKLQALCEEAVDQLGATDELAEFVQFLATSGAPVLREWVLGPGLRRLFTGPSAATAREQMPAVRDPATRSVMFPRAGQTCPRPGFKKYLDSLAAAGHADCQSPLLAGRCAALARTNLAGAIYAFRDFKTSGINHACLGQALAEVFKDADYAGVKAALKSLPEDLRRDAVQGLCGHQGKSVGAFLAAIDELIQSPEWPKISGSICVKLHNLTMTISHGDLMLSWAPLLPEREDTEELYRTALRAFLIYQPERAKKWLSEVPEGRRRQNGLAGFLHSSLHFRTHPADAMWAMERISDPDFINYADGRILEYEKRTGKTFPR